MPTRLQDTIDRAFDELKASGNRRIDQMAEAGKRAARRALYAGLALGSVVGAVSGWVLCRTVTGAG